MSRDVSRIERWQGPEDATAEWRLIEQVKRGDTDAFESLYRAHIGRIYALCLRMCRDPDRAQDLVQDVFVRAWDRLATFRGDSRFGTWLHRLAVHRVFEDLRRSKREAQGLDDLGLVALLHESQRAMPTTNIDLERAIAGLPAGAREVVILRDIEGYSYKEIAEAVGTSEGTVKSQINRGRRLLREAMRR
jgi:RNA polymerase sigma-70 factor (ECF subfamily)